MIERKDGVIIIISSVGGTKGNNLIGTYNLSKAADIQMVKNIAVGYGHHNIRANSIAPGLLELILQRDYGKILHTRSIYKHTSQ